MKCKHCQNTGWYKYTNRGTPHSKKCEYCCEHKEWWTADDGKEYCKQGCGTINQ